MDERCFNNDNLLTKINNLSFEASFERLLDNFNLNIYYKLLDKYGLKKTWEIIINEFKFYNINTLNNTFLKFDHIGELYEIGLAYTNKIKKKEFGKYYTPIDVAKIMAELLLENNIDYLVDVACGTGNLIIETIRTIRNNQIFDIIEFIKERRLYLYDIDEIAIKICIAKIELELGEQLAEYINIVEDDFLNKGVSLPNNCSVITNPPYSLITSFKRTWKVTKVLKQSKDYYAAFLDKIMDFCENAVIVSPQSFLVADKFSILRKKLGENFSGEIFAFDNVPGTLFNGRKHGIFNSNQANGVRAAITSLKRNKDSGFRLTHLIRFRTQQRQDVLNLQFLRSKLGNNIQNLDLPLKTFRELEPFVEEIQNDNGVTIADLIETNPENQDERFKIYISTSARYFTVASKRSLKRNGLFEIYAINEEMFKLIYALISSSYVYMWWRFYDGGILFSKRWLLKTPVSRGVIDHVENISPIVDEMIRDEEKYLTYKKNAGRQQESIKFPVRYRRTLNRILFNQYSQYFDLLHRNSEVISNE